jgi:coatomer subunit beta'
MKGSNSVSVGYDEGTVMFKIGREDPVASMDTSGKIIWAKHNDVQTANVKSLPAEYEVQDGDRLPLAIKDLGSCDLYPQSLVHGPNGRFVTVCGDGEYVIYTALAWRNKSFGAALDFGWSVDSSEFAVRESPSKIRIFNQFKEKTTFRPHFAAEGLYGGVLLGLRSTDFICFYDWAESRVIRRIDVSVKDVWWSESGEFVAIASDSSFFILRYNARVTAEALQSGEVDESEGVEDAFEVLIEIGEVIRTAVWVGDCFIYNNADWRLNYCVGGEVTTIFHLDRPMYLLGYLAAQNRVYLIDKEFSVVSYTLSLSLIDYKTLILRGEVDAAEEVLPTIPLEQHNNIARFLESRGFMADALRVATDPDYRFELAIQLGDLGIARGVIDHELTTSVSNKWKQLGELAMSMGDICLASTCLMNAGDLSGQLLLCSASASADKLEELAILASELGKHNVAFICLFLLNKIDDCIELLCSTGRIPEAAFMSRTYAPSKVSGVVDIWKADLALVNRKAADALADPDEYKNLFPNFDIALQAEGKSRLSPASLRKPARCFGEHENIPLPKLIEKVEELEVGVNLRVGADDQTQVPLEMIDTGLVDDDDFSSNSELISTSSAAAVDETAAKMHLSGGKAVSSDSDD